MKSVVLGVAVLLLTHPTPTTTEGEETQPWIVAWRIADRRAEAVPLTLGASGPCRLQVVWDKPDPNARLRLLPVDTLPPGRFELATNGRRIADVEAFAGAALDFPLPFQDREPQLLDLAWLGEGECRLAGLECMDADGDRRPLIPCEVPSLMPGVAGWEQPATAPLSIQELAPLAPPPLRWDLLLTNHSNATDLVAASSEIRVQFFNQGRTWFQRWEGPAVSLPAGGSREASLPLGFLSTLAFPPSAVEWIVRGPGDERALGRISAHLSPPPPARPFAPVEVKLQEENRQARLEAGDVRMTFDARAGSLIEYSGGRRALITGPVGATVWRPALPADLSATDSSRRELVREPVLMEVLRGRDGLSVRFRARYHDADAPDLLLMEGEETWAVLANGSLELSAKWTWRGPETNLSRLGFLFPLAHELDRALWLGKGPENTWRDGPPGALAAVHAAGRASSNFAGNKTAARWMHLFSDKRKFGLSFITPAPVDFDLLPLPRGTLLFAGRASGCVAPLGSDDSIHVAPGDELTQRLLLEPL
ncbi:hypothetical protein HS125_00505 [bacterium]|nr:hypothetical protein [bacterium]